jgi:hypothetical protein
MLLQECIPLLKKNPAMHCSKSTLSGMQGLPGRWSGGEESFNSVIIPLNKIEARIDRR